MECKSESQRLLAVVDHGEPGRDGGEGYGSLPLVARQPTSSSSSSSSSSAAAAAAELREELPDESPVMRKLIMSCVCIPDSSTKPTTFEQYCSELQRSFKRCFQFNAAACYPYTFNAVALSGLLFSILAVHGCFVLLVVGELPISTFLHLLLQS